MFAHSAFSAPFERLTIPETRWTLRWIRFLRWIASSYGETAWYRGWAIAKDWRNVTQLLRTSDGGRTWNAVKRSAWSAK
jgi:hypothetical protein